LQHEQRRPWGEAVFRVRGARRVRTSGHRRVDRGAEAGAGPVRVQTAASRVRGQRSRAESNPSRAADDAAAKLGFGSREPLVRRRKRQPIEEPVEQINLRAAVADINVFIEWCETNRYSYREGFGELVKHIDFRAA
jgi:hypothetical protein